MSGMTLPEFHNLLRVLHGIDLSEVEFLGDRWPKFRDDPVRFFLRADDEAARGIWEAMERRMTR